MAARERGAESLPKDNVSALATWWVAVLVRRAQTSAAASLATEDMHDNAPRAPERPKDTSVLPVAVKASFRRRHGIADDKTGTKESPAQERG